MRLTLNCVEMGWKSSDFISLGWKMKGLVWEITMFVVHLTSSVLHLNSFV